jgi:hypothetical protein
MVYYPYSLITSEGLPNTGCTPRPTLSFVSKQIVPNTSPLYWPVSVVQRLSDSADPVHSLPHNTRSSRQHRRRVHTPIATRPNVQGFIATVGGRLDAVPEAVSACDIRQKRRTIRASSSRPSQRFRRYDSGRDSDGDRVGQVYAAQFVPRGIQIGLHAGERQIQKRGDVVKCFASRSPDETFLLSFRQFDRLRRQLEIDASRRVDQSGYWL